MHHKSFLKKLQTKVLYLLLFLLPTQLGKHFFMPESFLSGIRIDYLAPTIYFTDLILVSAIILFLISISRSNKHIVLTKKCVALFKNKVTIFIFILIVLNIFFSLEPVISLYRYSKLLEIVFIYFLVRHTKVPSKNILLVLVISTFLQLLLVILQMVSHGSIQGMWYLLGERSFHLGTPGIAKISLRGVEIMRGYGTFSHPNSLAGFYLLLHGFVLYYKPFQKYIASRKIFLTLSFLLILFSFSKIAIVGLIGISMYKIAREKSNCVPCLLSQIILPLTLGIVFLSGVGDPDSVAKRLWLAKSSLLIIKDHFLTGVGLGNYLIAQSTFSIPYAYFFLQPVHNIFLLITSEIGVPLTGFVLFYGHKYLRATWSSKTIQVLVTIIVFTGMLDHYWLTLQQNLLLVPVVFGLLQKHKSMVK